MATLTGEQKVFYEEKGWLRLEAVCTGDEVETLRAELDFLFEHWAQEGSGWKGDWIQRYMDAETARKARGVVLHNLERYAAGWNRFIYNAPLIEAVADLIGPNVEFHSTSTHVKGPEAGMAFPMHQDSAFYNHANDRLVIAALHLDDTNDENGVFRFVDGSHRTGLIPHVIRNADGSRATPHLSVEEHPLENSTPVYCRAGDVVLFNLHTIHGSDVNRSPHLRRLVVARYRDPQNIQQTGINPFGPMVAGVRPPVAGMKASVHQITYLTQIGEEAGTLSERPLPQLVMNKEGQAR
ncbi:MAG: hypothetical protein OHK0029_12960 [Armatimonadaceae bacterium]